ncbi:GntR family transcriptional regulator [Lysobacter sp. K5869]|uniref:GntR family transcriptional regulator n=1 Tax=Lysobacter sp. K5869 TaxID=2820808 RepID=UPI001C063BF6|nr:GntR family transcriptional regulator [Lysobacter sp. K5869]QWP77943.1 GntR family transcriptional regulator [Lysobacter sp. K5869]
MSILPRSLSDQAFEVVRERILSTQIPPLAPIRQELLAEELGISKIPLREALSRLEEQGLLSSHPNRGFFVPPLTSTEAEEVFALRLKIEPEAAAQACLAATESDQETARAALRALEQAGHDDPHAGVRYNRAFHLALVGPGGRQITAQLVERLQVLAERYVRKHLEPAGREARAAHEHQAILDAWLQRDAAVVDQLLSTHILTTLHDLRVQLEQIPDTGPLLPDFRRAPRRRREPTEAT